MQVNDSPAPPASNSGIRDEVRAVDPAESGPSRSGQRFRKTLERKRRDLGAVPHDGASAAAMAAWFRPESGTAPPPRPAGVAATSAARSVERVLIGAGPDGAEARIRIGAGALAGTEIQLSAGAASNAVEARLLTHTASSRQTLSLVMDEIRSRLRDRGIILFAKAPAAPADGRRDDPGAQQWLDGERSPR